MPSRFKSRKTRVQNIGTKYYKYSADFLDAGVDKSGAIIYNNIVSFVPFVMFVSCVMRKDMGKEIPEYMKILQYVYGNIANAKLVGGSLKIHTEAELCRIFGVCRKTVRKALDQLVEEGLLIRKPSRGTFIRPEVVDSYSMRFGDNLAIGLVYGAGTSTFLSDYYMIQTEKIFERLRANDCIARQIYFNGNSEQEAELLNGSKLDGIIWLAPERKHIPTMQTLKSCNIPVVSTFPSFISDEFNSVALDYYKCGYTVAKYLLDHGHRRILYINKNPSDVEAVKKAGCKAAFADCGAEWHERLWNCNANGFRKPQVESIIEHAGKFSAVNCHEIHVYHVKQLLANRKDVQIIHNIHSESAAGKESVPEILIPVAQTAEIAVEMLLEIIKYPSVKARQLLLESAIIEPETYKPKSKQEVLK